MKKSFIKAFTLVELLVVIAILAILSTVGIIGYNSFTEKAYVSNDETRAELINRHLQIYQMDNPLNSEEDLKVVIDEMYGEDAFNKLEPQSAKYGYHYWFNIETKQVKLSKVEDVNNASGVNYVARTNKFDAKGSFRAGLVSNHLLLDRSGSEIANALTKIDTISTAEDYKYVISQTLKAKKSDHDQKLGTALENKLESTAIISNEGSFRYSDVSNVENIYYTLGTNSISSVLHEYDGKNVITSYLSNVNNKYIATGTHFVLPSNIINVSSYSFFFDENNIPTLSTSFEESQLLEVFKANATNAIIELTKDEVVNQYKFENGTLKNITTGVEIGTPDYSNPVQDGDFIIKCLEDNNGKVKQLDKLYVAYDQQTFNLKAEFSNDEVSSKEVTWTSSNSNVISIDDTGFAKIESLPLVLDSHEITLRATAVAGEHYEEIVVSIVRPISGTIKFNNSNLLIDNTNVNNNIEINYEGEIDEFSFADFNITYNVTGLDAVNCDINYEITTYGELFEINGNSNDGYTLKLKDYEGSQQFTIKVGDYLEKSFTVNVIDNSESPFELVFENTDKYMYRVGNINTITLSSLFRLMDGKNIDGRDVNLSIYDASKKSGNNKLEYIATSGDGFSAIYTKKLTSSNWSTSTIKFNKTGVVILEIGVGSLSTRLALEVVDGSNVTSTSGVPSGNVVLLEDIEVKYNANANTCIYLTNAALYGNGFTIHAEEYHDSYEAILMVNNSTIDNVRIIGGTFAKVVMSGNDYYNSAIYVIGGDTVISNSYISGCRSPIRFKGTNLTLKNTTLDGGVFANMIVDNGSSIILDDVTTVQTRRKATLGGTNDVIGMGILVWEYAPSKTKIAVKGDLKQYNWVRESDISVLPSDYQSIARTMFTNSSYSSYWHTINGVKYVNLTVIFEGEPLDDSWNDKRSDSIKAIVPYTSLSASIVGSTGVVKSINNSVTIPIDRFVYNDSYYENVQAKLEPTIEFNHSLNYIKNNDDGNSYCYYDSDLGIYKIGVKENEVVNFDPKIITINKYGLKINATIIMHNKSIESIDFDTEGSYVIEYTYDDPYQFDINGNVENLNISYTKYVYVEVIILKPDAIPAEFTFANGASTTSVVINNEGKTKTYVMPNVNTTNSKFGVITNSNENIYYPIVEGVDYITGTDLYRIFYIFAGISIKDYDKDGLEVNYNLNTAKAGMPATISLVGWTNISSTADNGKWTGIPDVTEYNNKPCYSGGAHNYSIGKTVKEGLIVMEYSYVDNTGKTYYYYIGYHFAEKSNNGCVTDGTLITLADGTHKTVEELTGNEMILVWNYVTGKYESAPIAYIVNHDNKIAEHEITHLYFSDGTDLEIIGEHGFFDSTLNEWIYISSENVYKYIGHDFISQSNISENQWKKIKLERVSFETRQTGVYEVVSYKHLACFTNGVLSVSGYTGGLLNIFDINGDELCYDQDKMIQDIEKYGLFTYDDFKDLVPEKTFEMYNATYLKIAIGKGYMTWEDVLKLIDIYYDNDVRPLD